MPRRGENIYRRKDGRYEGRYIIGKSENGKTHFGYVYGQYYTVVRNELLKRKAAQLNQHPRQMSCGVLLETWYRQWMITEKRMQVKDSSYQTYQRLYRCHIQPVLGHTDLAMITAGDVREFLEILYRKKLAAQTVGSILRLLSSLLEGAVNAGLIGRNPCRGVRLSIPESAEQRVLSVQEQQLLHRAMGEKELPAMLALYSGMRLGEVCALRWTDVNWERRTVWIRRTVQRVKAPDEAATAARTALMLGPPKSAHSLREIPLPDFLLDSLRALAQQSDSEYLFGRGAGMPEPRTIQRNFAALTHRLHLENVHFHTLRHTYATRLMELGVDVKTISTLLGHSSVRTTLDFYAHSLLEQQRQAVDQLAQFLP